jgi:hypothetical protein
MVMESNKLNLIRRMVPTLMAEELVGVQPMSDNTMSSLIKWIKSNEKPMYNQGDRIRCFARGWLRYYGTEFISQDLWISLKIKGL